MNKKKFIGQSLPAAAMADSQTLFIVAQCYKTFYGCNLRTLVLS
jgi:hypothetical protein